MARLGMVLSLVGVSLVLQANNSHACEELVRHDEVQLAALEKQYFQSESRLLKLKGFDELACSAVAGIRDHVLRDGINSDFPSLRVSALEKIILSKNAVIVVPFDDLSGLSEEQLKFIRESPIIQYVVAGRDFEKRCLSTYFQYEDCRPNRQILVDGLQVTMMAEHRSTEISCYKKTAG